MSGVVRCIAGQIALALTALFISVTMVLPYNGGYVLAYALMALTLVLALALLIVRGRWEIGGAGWCFFGALVLIAVSFGINADWPMIVNFAFLLAFVPLASWLRRFAAPDGASVVSWLALVGTVLSAATALLEVLVLKNDRAEGWWSDPIWSAEAAMILGFLSLMAFPIVLSRWRLLLLLGPILGLGIVVLSGSRGPLLAAPMVVLILMLTTFRTWRKQIAAGCVVLAIAGAAMLPFAPAAMQRVEQAGIVVAQLLTTGDVAEESAGARIAFWRAGIAAFKDRPLAGYGWSKFVKAAYQYLPDKGKAYEAVGSSIRGNHHLHADILNFGVAGGVLGLAAYGLILLAPLLGAIRSVPDGQRRARLTGALVLSAGYAACGLSYLMFGYEFHTTLYVCLTAIVLGFCRDEPTPRRLPA